MPPKKDTNGEANEGGKFVWEGPNDTKLLLLTQGRYVKPDEYEQLASAFTGATTGSIRNRISALRVKQRNMYEERAWQLPEGGAGYSNKKGKGDATPTPKGKTASKRSAGEDDGEVETPTKKARVIRKKKVQEEKKKKKKKDSEVVDEDEDEEGGVVKREPEEEMEV